MKSVIPKFRDVFSGKKFVFLILLSFLIQCIIEILSRRSIMSLLLHIGSMPHIFLLNSLIVLCTFLPALLVKRRAFAIILISALWAGFGIANCVIMSLRGSPFTARDILLIRDGLSVVAIYLSTPQIILIIAAIVAAMTGVVAAYLKLPKCTEKPGTRIAAAVISVTVMVVTITGAAAVRYASDNASEAYENFGFAYSFTRSVFSSGLNRPEEYSEASVMNILLGLVGQHDIPERRVNVIFVQLESFFDPSEINHLALSENPTPVFSALKSTHPSGYLTVPVLGAGTVNTEFEILTGLDLMHFGIGEYPYESMLRETHCESIASNLRNLGYTAHAIHNHDRGFYSRDDVYPNLGFERFISIEDMHNVQYTLTGWAKDEILLDYILESLKITAGRDFVFAVTVQGHGKYPKDFDAMDFDVIESDEFEHLNSGSFEYYLTQLRETDTFLGKLIHALESYDEEVLLVLYGDHLPVLPIAAEDLKSGSLYRTEYAIWNNFGLEAADRALEANEISAYVLGLIGLSEGVITKIHQQYEDKSSRDEALRMIGYDMLHGQRYFEALS